MSHWERGHPPHRQRGGRDHDRHPNRWMVIATLVSPLSLLQRILECTAVDAKLLTDLQQLRSVRLTAATTIAATIAGRSLPL